MTAVLANCHKFKQTNADCCSAKKQHHLCAFNYFGHTIQRDSIEETR